MGLLPTPPAKHRPAPRPADARPYLVFPVDITMRPPKSAPMFLPKQAFKSIIWGENCRGFLPKQRGPRSHEVPSRGNTRLCLKIMNDLKIQFTDLQIINFTNGLVNLVEKINRGLRCFYRFRRLPSFLGVNTPSNWTNEIPWFFSWIPLNPLESPWLILWDPPQSR